MRYLYTQISPSLPPRPYLRICLRHEFATTDPMLALVDSGTDRSLFPYELAAKILKIDLHNPPAKQWVFYGTSGAKQFAYLANVEITILQKDGNDIHLQTEVGFCPEFQFPGGPLLGQIDFFSHFKTITFSQLDNCFDLEPRQFEMTLPK